MNVTWRIKQQIIMIRRVTRIDVSIIDQSIKKYEATSAHAAQDTSSKLFQLSVRLSLSSGSSRISMKLGSSSRKRVRDLLDTRAARAAWAGISVGEPLRRARARDSELRSWL